MAKEKFIAVHDKLTEHAQMTPGAIAVICADKELSYKELDQKSDYLAASLFTLIPEIRQGDFITLVLDRSFSIHIAIMGVLKRVRPLSHLHSTRLLKELHTASTIPNRKPSLQPQKSRRNF